mgnify:CR=1 FL=1
MAVFLLSSLTMINLLLWLVFLVRFKKLFSADDIMTKFRDGMESLLGDAQRNTLSNINLIEEKTKELKAASAEAERKVAILRRELQSAEKSAAFQAQLNLRASSSGQSGEERPSSAPLGAAKVPAKKAKGRGAAKTSPKASSRAAAAYKQNRLPGEDEAYALTGLFQENAEKSLFEEPQITVTKDGDAYGKVPIVKTEIVASDNPIEPKKPFARRVREMADLGKSVEEIASETDHSTTEVQLVLDMI